MKSLPILLLSNIKKTNISIVSDNFIDVEIYRSELKILQYNDRETVLSYINIILGLDVNYEGSYYLNGVDISGLMKKAKRLEIGRTVFFTSYRYGLIHELNVIDNILLQFKCILGLNKRKVISVLTNMGLLYITYRKIRELSPYELLQLFLLIAILKKNKIIIIDLSPNDCIYNEFELNRCYLFNLIKENDMSLLLIKKMDMDITKNTLSIING